MAAQRIEGPLYSSSSNIIIVEPLGLEHKDANDVSDEHKERHQ
jgi:hypothetical protein